MKDAKTGKIFTSHWQTSPRNYVKETCLGCHQGWTEKQAIYTIDSLKSRFKGKLRKAEYWLTRMVDKFEEAKNLGVDEARSRSARQALRGARALGVLDASNGAYFHNPKRGRLDQQGHGDLAGGHQDARRRDGEEARRRQDRGGCRPSPGSGSRSTAK